MVAAADTQSAATSAAAAEPPVCLVTGGSRGIGRACALALGSTGAKVRRKEVWPWNSVITSPKKSAEQEFKELEYERVRTQRERRGGARPTTICWSDLQANPEG